MRAEARRRAAKNANHKNARRRRACRGKGAIMGKVCGTSGKKPMAQWNWEAQDRGSRTKKAKSGKEVMRQGRGRFPKEHALRFRFETPV